MVGMCLHQSPCNDAWSAIAEELKVKHVTNPGIQLNAHVKVIECGAYYNLVSTVKQQCNAKDKGNINHTTEPAVLRVRWPQVRFDIHKRGRHKPHDIHGCH